MQVFISNQERKKLRHLVTQFKFQNREADYIQSVDEFQDPPKHDRNNP